MDKCSSCYYCHDGICINHCYADIDLSCSDVSNDFDGLTLDPYGIEICYIHMCDGYRKNFHFLSKQVEL